MLRKTLNQMVVSYERSASFSICSEPQCKLWDATLATLQRQMNGQSSSISKFVFSKKQYVYCAGSKYKLHEKGICICGFRQLVVRSCQCTYLRLWRLFSSHLICFLLSLLSGLFTHPCHALNHTNDPSQKTKEPSINNLSIFTFPSTRLLNINSFNSA